MTSPVSAFTASFYSPHFASVQREAPKSNLTKTTQVVEIDGRAFQANQSEDNYNVSKYMTSAIEHTLEATKTTLGLFHFVKGRFQMFLSTIDHDQSYAQAVKLAQQCDQVGDIIVFNFNDGVHSAVLVRTDAGLAYLTYPIPWSHVPKEQKTANMISSPIANADIEQRHLESKQTPYY